MKKLVVFLSVLLALMAASAGAQTCPSTERFIRIFTNENGNIKFEAMFVGKNLLPGTDNDCPNIDLVAQMMVTDNRTNEVDIISVGLEKGSVSNPLNILSEQDIKLYKEKGIVNPPKIKEQKKPPVPTGNKTTADADTEALYSSVY